MPNNTILIDHKRNVISAEFAGDSFLDGFGWPAFDRCIGKSINDIHKYHQFDTELFNRKLDKLVDRELDTFTLQFCTKDGGFGFRGYQITAHYNESDSVFADLTYVEMPFEPLPKHIIFRRANLNENLFRLVPTAIIFQDISHRIRFANPAAEKMLGLSETELLNITTPSSLPWDLYDNNGELMGFFEHPGNAAIAQKLPKRNVILKIKGSQDARPLWVKANAEPIFDAHSGVLQGAITSFSDINGEQNVKLSLQSLTDRMQVAIDAAEMGVWDWVPDEHLMIWDHQMFKLYGVGDDESVLPKEAFIRALHPDDRRNVRREIMLLLRGKNNHDIVDFRVIWPDGSVHHIRAQARVSRNKAGKVDRIVGVAQDITKEILSEERLRDLAYQDELTKVWSRAGLRFRLDQLFNHMDEKHAKESGIGLILLGVDRFKDINDNFGHPVGDALLIEIAKRMQAFIGDQECLARLGSDEFVLLTRNPDFVKDLQAVAQKIALYISESFYLGNGPVLQIKASIGVACAPTDGKNTADILRAVDLALSYAKQNGGDRIVSFEASMLEVVNKRYKLKNKLQMAVFSEDFMLHYQPIVDLSNKKVIGCEALIRWCDQEGKFISPMEFIPIAEEVGLIYDLGKWVCKTAIIQWLQWSKYNSDLEYISVNVSPLQLRQSNYVEDLMAMVEEYQINPKNIQLEITEGTFLKETINENSALNALAKHGFRLAIDDFGTGYSSLAYLKRFDVDLIKIDRSFIIDIETDQSDKDIVGAIIAMNKKLGFKTLVEGIETLNQSDIVAELGCDSVQGYYYGRPVFADEFAEKYLTCFLLHASGGTG